MSSRVFTPGKERRLEDLISVGPAMLRDFELLGIRSMTQLARANPQHMYKQLCSVTGRRQDICVQDVFRILLAKSEAHPFKPLFW